MIRYFVLIFFLAVTCSTAQAATTIYKWTDSSGVVHFSDTPDSPNAVAISSPEQLNQINPAPAKPDVNPTNPNPKSTPTYSQITITNPTPNFTYVNNETGIIAIALKITPELQPEDRVQVLLDGKPAGEPQATTAPSIANIDRGTHSLQIQILNKNKTVLATSEPVTFMMQRPRVLKHLLK